MFISAGSRAGRGRRTIFELFQQILATLAGLETVPIGTILEWGGANLPTDRYVWADGKTDLPRAHYAALFAAYGTTHGADDGDTFGVPDKRGRVGVGRDDMGGSAANRITNAVSGFVGTTLGAAGGSQSHTLTTSELAAHPHPAGAQGFLRHNPGSGSWQASAGTDFELLTDTGNAGGGQAHLNVQPSIICNYVIFAGVSPP